MEPQKTEQQTIDTGSRIAEFVKDPDIQAAVARVATRNFAGFKKAKTADELRLSAAKATVLDEFLSELQVDIDRGQVAQTLRAERERRESRKKPS